MAQQLVTPEEVLKAQGSASTTRLAICVGVVFLHGMMCGASLGYGGLVLPHHLDPASPSGLLHLDQEQASWFNSVSPWVCAFASWPAYQSAYRPASDWEERRCSWSATSSLACPLIFAPHICISDWPVLWPWSGGNHYCLLCYTAISPLVPVSLLSIGLAFHCLVDFLLILVLLPDSRQWLVTQGKEEDARASLKRLRGAR